MELIFSEFRELRGVVPFVFWGAMAFYASLLFLLIPKIRVHAVRVFTPPAPITQSLLKPLDSLRGLAAIASAFFHTWAWNGPFYQQLAEAYPIIRVTYKSVPFFAVLSGFLIYRSVKNFSGFENFHNYAKRRILRIYPVYITTLLCFYAFMKITPEIPHLFQRMLPEAFMMRIFGFTNMIYPGYWSLYVEELFYISIPIWVFATKRRPVVASCIALALFALPGSAISDELSMMKFFFFGILLCEFMGSHWKEKINEMKAAAIFVAGCTLLYFEHTRGDIIGQLLAWIVKPVASLTFDTPNIMDGYNRYFSFSLGVGFALLILGSLCFSPIYRFLSLTPLRFLGAISYSVFLWNAFVMLVGTNAQLSSIGPGVMGAPFISAVDGTWWSFFGIYTAAFLFYGSVSYVLVERPFMLMRNKGRS